MSRQAVAQIAEKAEKSIADDQWFLGEVDHRFSIINNASVEPSERTQAAKDVALLYIAFDLALKRRKKPTSTLRSYFHVDSMLLAESELVPLKWLDLRRENLETIIGPEERERVLALLPRIPIDDPEVTVRGNFTSYTYDGFVAKCANVVASSRQLLKQIRGQK